ncbi:MAG TPA: ABC transporter permease [Thermoanaerobaculia bacterium]|nr:ABC transporter permease [Thermoanaerobaculia bacterium]
MNLPRTIAWRYLRRPSDRLVSAVGVVSVLGLIIGVMALVISMALMTGYRDDLQKKLLGGNAEVFVYSREGNIDDLERVLAQVRATPGVQSASPVLFQHALISPPAGASGEQVMLKGVEPRRAGSSPMLAKIVGPSGRFDSVDSVSGISVGRYLARRLKVVRGDAVTLNVPTSSSGSFLPRTGTFIVNHIYETGFFEFDARWAFIDLVDARSLIDAEEGANLIEVKVTPRAKLADVVAAIDKRTERRFAVSDWRAANQQLFALLTIQQTVLFVVIGLIVFVSTFNIVSTLIMTVHEKRREIGILMSMGASKGVIRTIFLWYGTMVGLAGTVSGLFAGVMVCYLITKFELVTFGPEIAEVYFISSIPFIARWKDLSVIALFTMTVSFAATVLPALRAARIAPVDALRHE